MSLTNEQRAHDIAIAVLRSKQDQMLQATQKISNKFGMAAEPGFPQPTEIYLNAYENSLKLLEEKGR